MIPCPSVGATQVATARPQGKGKAMAQELILLTRLFDLLAWLMPKAERFPRAHRSTVTLRLMNAALDCQEAVFAAQAGRDDERLRALRAADAALNRLRLYLLRLRRFPHTRQRVPNPRRRRRASLHPFLRQDLPRRGLRRP